MQGIRIIGTGMCIPEMVVSNEDYTKFVDTSDEWITTRTGIKTRHISDGSPAFLMSVESAKRALADAGIEAKDIDLILHTSVTPDYVTPSMSCILQGKIGALNAMCIDINCACAAFVYALDMARRYLATGDVKNVLIVSTEILSKITDYEDRSTCVLFGDGAGAAGRVGCLRRDGGRRPVFVLSGRGRNRGPYHFRAEFPDRERLYRAKVSPGL